MELDVRLPMGAMFVLLGGLLTAYGIFSDASIYKKSLGFNINLWWGLVILGFGALMLLLAWMGRKSIPLATRSEPVGGTNRGPTP